MTQLVRMDVYAVSVGELFKIQCGACREHGFRQTSLFKENILCQRDGLAFLALVRLFPLQLL